MPTENRSSNTEMVSVPRHWAQETVNAGAGECVSRSDIALLSEALSQPAQQHQGEPVALPARESLNGRLPGHEAIGWNACLDEIAKLGPLYSRPGQGEPVGEIVSAQDSGFRVQWMPGIWPEQLPMGTKLYTHADHAEVERLRAEIEEWNRIFDMQEGKIDALRAQLAEAQALLGKALTDLDHIQDECEGDVTAGYIGCLVDDVVALLSVSAEPSAPVEIDERSYFEAAYSEHAAEHTSARYNLVEMRRGEEYRVGYHYLNGAWFGWQARAALERKP